jgi:hypothetical protein
LFHHYANNRKNHKQVWDLHIESGLKLYGQQALKEGAVEYFKQLGTTTGILNEDQTSVANLYPPMVTEAEAQSMDQPCKLEDLKKILKAFACDKSPSPDGWTVEFFLYFFDLVGADLLGMVEESRKTGDVIKALNTTFLVLIPKSSKPSNFDDFRPISLCNLCCKIIAKLLANRLRPILSKGLAEEQLGFLHGRQILDAVGTAQESLHGIKQKKQRALILKLDLMKAHDLINWDFLTLILHKAGSSLATIRWIMSCVSSVSYVVIINGEPSTFFQRDKGLRQGCPLSPLLFIMVMESLSLLINGEKIDGSSTGITVSRIIKILHLLFVDDILTMSREIIDEWAVIACILNIFQNATGLQINEGKSLFLTAGLDDSDLMPFKALFPYHFEPFETGFKYLGFF